jgi:hypothetical protein
MVEDERQVPRGRPRVPRLAWLALLGAVSLSLGVALAWRGAEPPATPAISSPQAGGPTVARRERRPTLDPAQFVGKAATAHRVAREIPEVLDQLYCYCGCDKHQGHKSLLSCYTDGHAAT